MINDVQDIVADVLENILARRSPWRQEVDSAKKSHVLRQNRSPLIRSRQHLIWGLLDQIVVGTDVEEIADTSSGQCRRRARHQLAAERELVTHACCIYSTVPLLQPFFNDGINALVGAAFASRSLAIPSSARPVAHRGRTKRFDLSGISHDAPPRRSSITMRARTHLSGRHTAVLSRSIGLRTSTRWRIRKTRVEAAKIS